MQSNAASTNASKTAAHPSRLASSFANAQQHKQQQQQQWIPKASSIVQQHRQRLHQGAGYSIIPLSSDSASDVESLSRSSSTRSASSSISSGSAYSSDGSESPSTSIVRLPWRLAEQRGESVMGPIEHIAPQPHHYNPHHLHMHAGHTSIGAAEPPLIAFKAPQAFAEATAHGYQQQQQHQQHEQEQKVPMVRRKRSRSNSVPNFHDYHLMFGRVE